MYIYIYIYILSFHYFEVVYQCLCMQAHVAKAEYGVTNTKINTPTINMPKMGSIYELDFMHKLSTHV